MFADEKKLIDDRLLEITAHYHALGEPMQYALFSGGKRLRPLLLLLILKDLRLLVKDGLDVACAIEMIHTYSLIHDDLPAMDNDDMRRGKPTVHIVFGEDIAILTGDALLTEAIFILSQANIKNDKKIELITLITKLCGARGMIYGQWLDIKKENHTMDDIAIIHQHKTTDLIQSAISSAAIMADECDAIWLEIGHHLGRAFQIKDDLDDVNKADNASIVKTIGVEQSETTFFAHRTKCLKLIEEKLGKKDTYLLVESIL